jgi:hypothetical protein
MTENRRYIRFASISGIDRRDLPIAAEVWLESIAQSCWTDRNILKLATLFMKYMRDPNPALVRFASIGQSVGLDGRGLDSCLRLMAAYGAVETYDCSGDALRVSLNLTYLQRLRVLEIARRFTELQRASDVHELPWHCCEKNWLARTVPSPNVEPEIGVEVSEAPALAS